MVLVEVIKLIVHVDGAFDRVRSGGTVLQQVHDASLRTLSHVVPLLQVLPADRALGIIGHDDLFDLIRHHVQYDARSQEDDCEDRERKCCRHGSGHGAPGWQRLLLELGLFEAFDFLSNGLLISSGDLHILNN